jgi:triosephosphate isomerase
MRNKIVAGNWKMNLDYQEGISLFSEILHMVGDETRGNQQVIVCSPFIHLYNIAQQAKDTKNVFAGAQNIHQNDSGAYTGETSASQVKSTGASYVILGHSERRAYFGEDEKLLEVKLNQALKNGLKPIFCVGETKDERESGQFWDILAKQLKETVFLLSKEDFANVVLAYEPVWAIGTGLTATPEQAQEVHAFIREEIARSFDQEVADSTSILYGGSCNPKNAAELFSQADIDGGLIGGASLKSRDFLDIVNVFNGH